MFHSILLPRTPNRAGRPISREEVDKDQHERNMEKQTKAKDRARLARQQALAAHAVVLEAAFNAIDEGNQNQNYDDDENQDPGFYSLDQELAAQVDQLNGMGSDDMDIDEEDYNQGNFFVPFVPMANAAMYPPLPIMPIAHQVPNALPGGGFAAMAAAPAQLTRRGLRF